MANYEALVANLIAHGFIIMGGPGDWFVGYGSHGGSAPTLRKAVLSTFFIFLDELLHVLDDTPIGNTHWRWRFCQWCHRGEGYESK